MSMLDTRVSGSDEFYEIQDKILSEETSNKALVSCMEINPISQNHSEIDSKIALSKNQVINKAKKLC